MKYIFPLILFLIVIKNNGNASDNLWLTYYEKSGYLETPRYHETFEFIKKIDDTSKIINLSVFGKSPQNRDIPIVIIDKDGLTHPDEIRQKGRLICLIQCCIHAGECDGKDAMMMLMRDIAIYLKYKDILDNVTIVWIPIFNVDGHERFGPNNRINQNGPKEMGWRTNANNLNLNRDYLKAESPEMKAWLTNFNFFKPEFFIDCHTTDGADYQYAVTYGLEIYGSMDSGLTQWLKDSYLKYAEIKMKEAGFPIFKYVYFRNWHDPRSGLSAGVSPPMLSQSYTSMLNCPGLLIETHMLKDYKTRVDGTYEMLKNTLIFLSKENKNLKKLITNANLLTSSSKFRTEQFPVRWITSQKDSVFIDFLGVDYEGIKSDLSGGTWFKYSDKKTTFQIPFFYKPGPSVLVKLPEAYIVPVEWSDVISKLALHGIRTKTIKKPLTLKVSTYKFKNVAFAKSPYEGRFRVSNFDYEEIIEEKIFEKGSVIVDMNQSSARIIAYLLEPKADGSLLEWGFFNSIFEQKEYAESYVMEKEAREMLKNNPQLKSEFEQKLASDPDFASSSWDILNWFYLKSKWRDENLNIYPIGKIFVRKVINQLLDDN